MSDVDAAATARAARQSAGLTHRELAERAGIHQPTLSAIDRGEGVPRRETASGESRGGHGVADEDATDCDDVAGVEGHQAQGEDDGGRADTAGEDAGDGGPAAGPLLAQPEPRGERCRGEHDDDEGDDGCGPGEDPPEHERDDAQLECGAQDDGERTAVRGRMPSGRPRQRCSAMVRATMTASPPAVRTRRVVSSGCIGVPFLVLSGTRDRAPGLLGVTLKSVPLSITRATPGCRACQVSVRRPASACAPGSGPWEGGGVPPKQSSFPAEMSLIRHGRIRSSSDGHLSLRSQTG